MKSQVPMIPFLRSVAQEVISRKGVDLSRFCFVLPGKRACLFLEQHIRSLTLSAVQEGRRAHSMPRIMTLAEFIEKITGKRTGSRLELIFTLFAAWKQVSAEKADFEEFRIWAETVLSDFNEIDLYDVNPEGIFQNIENFNEISTDYLTEEQRRIVSEYFGMERKPRQSHDFWQHMSKGSQLKDNFLALWRRLLPLYHSFREQLAATDFSYEGALTQSACDIIDSRGVEALPAPNVVMVGFDLLTTCRLRLFALLRDLKVGGERITDFFWDSPGTPLAKESPVDAGRFQWLNMERFPCSVKDMMRYTEHLTLPPVLDEIACPGNTAQAKVTGKLLADIIAGRGAPFTDPARVAVVLPDESLLFPTYYAMPASVAPDVNITMGYPVKITNVATFIVLLRKLQRSVRMIEGSVNFHFKDLRTLLAHPFMQLLLGVEGSEKMQGYIVSNHLFYAKVEELLYPLAGAEKERAAEVLQAVLKPMGKGSTGADVCAWLRTCLLLTQREIVRGITHKEMKRLDVSMIESYLAAIDEYDKLATQHSLNDMHWRTALTLIDRIMQNHTVHLQGEPLTGVQIMGMLETRCLDFDYLIIPSMNERIFPRRLRVHTFIPETLRRGWMLPTLRQKEQAYAYHFYRLIARAREVHLLYDASQGGRKSGDPSRYLLQLKYLFPGAGSLKCRSARFNINSPAEPVLKVAKQAADLEPFFDFNSRSNLSASSLKDYLACPLRFYLAHVLRKKVSKEPEEFMDAATQGTVLHESMQTIYDSLLPPGHEPDKIYPRRITPGLIKSWLNGEKGVNIEAIVAAKIKETYAPASRMNELSGDALLMAEVISRYVRYCLQADMKIAPFDYIDNENKVKVQYPLKGGKKVNMTFIIDRLDRLITPEGNRLRIVDYKTGSDVMGFKKVDDLFHPSQSAGNTKGIFQLMLYSLLYPLHDKDFGFDTPIALSLYSTRTLEVNEFRTMVEFKEEPVYSHLPLIEEYKELLDSELSTLFDLNQPFEQTPDKQKCLYCDFRKLCGR